MSLLDKVNMPADLKKIPADELPILAQEIRDRITHVVSESGGHLASNLGVVELTMAMHYVYNTPKDKIVWDVGHQCYTHKILTGRNSKLDTLRQHNGISGFPKTEESEYDSFNVGHASTSISAALGIAAARDIKGDKFNVIAVIGDGSMTGGLAYEGLNNAGAKKTNITVILNDNKMSISKNVGAMSHYLTKVISDPIYNKLKTDLWNLTGKMPKFGDQLRKVVSSIDEGIKHVLIPGKLFEDLGFRYFGVIDGHNINHLIDVLKNVKNNVEGPVLIHVNTLKGKGITFAEKDSTRFHGVSGFEKESGKFQKTTNDIPTYTSVFSKTIVKLATENKNIVAETAAMPDGTGLNLFNTFFPDRFFDVGIAESHAVTFAAGLATMGLRPVVAMYSTFLQRGFDQLIHDVALTKQPIIFCLDRAGLVGDDGPTHHGSFDLSYLRLIPNTVIMSPKDEAELCHMLKTAVSYTDGPIFIRYPRGSGLGVTLPEKLVNIPIGKGEILKEGKNVLILAIGDMVCPALESAEILNKNGINPTVVNARFVKPLDLDFYVPLFKEHDVIATVESNTLCGGFSGAIFEAVGALGLAKTFINLSYPDTFVEHGNKQLLLKEIGLDKEGIANKILSVVVTKNKI